MSKNWLYVHEGKTRKVKKAYYVLGGKTHAIKKAYVVKDGLTRLFYSGGMEVTYTGTHTIKDVTKDGVAYKLYTMTGSGTLTVSGDGAQYWICGGGGHGGVTGGYWYDENYGYYGNSGGGGAGGYTQSGTISDGVYAVTIGAAAGNSTIEGVITANAGGGGSSSGAGGNGGSGGGAGVNYQGVKTVGKGDGKSKYPFGITSLYAHCAGGGGGARGVVHYGDTGYLHGGGAGGTNGGNGGSGSKFASGPDLTVSGGTGGNRGGGKGGNVVPTNTFGTNATFYGSGGGGATYKYSYATGRGSGYQGVCYLLVPAG